MHLIRKKKSIIKTYRPEQIVSIERNAIRLFYLYKLLTK